MSTTLLSLDLSFGTDLLSHQKLRPGRVSHPFDFKILEPLSHSRVLAKFATLPFQDRSLKRRRFLILKPRYRRARWLRENGLISSSAFLQRIFTFSPTRRILGTYRIVGQVSKHAFPWLRSRRRAISSCRRRRRFHHRKRFRDSLIAMRNSHVLNSESPRNPPIARKTRRNVSCVRSFASSAFSVNRYNRA